MKIKVQIICLLVVLLGTEQYSRGAVYTDITTTRAQMTADNPALDGFFANVSESVQNFFTSPTGSGATFLWNDPVNNVAYFAIGAHEDQGGLIVNNVYTGRDVITDPGDPLPINRIDFSTNADFAIITTPITAATIALQNSRSPNSKLVGVAVAASENTFVTIYVSLLGQLDFINQVTGSDITTNQVLSGQSIIGVPQTGDEVFSDGYGNWGTVVLLTPTTGLNANDGLPNQWQGIYIPNGGGLFGSWSDPTLYFATTTDADPLSAFGSPGDSGSVGIIVVTPVAAQILSLTITNADVQLVWSGKGGSNYVVQAASALGGTNTFTDISTVVTLPGVGPVTTNYFDAGALTNFPARIYRIRTN